MPVHNFFQRFSVRDMVIMAVMAALGVALKPLVVPLAHMASAPLGIPSGSLAGGLYMMWIVMGFGLTGKYGTGTVIGLVQALAVMLTGVAGSHGIMTIFSYTLPGIAVDLGLLLIHHRVCCRQCAVLAGILANVTGTLCVNLIFFRLPGLYLVLTISVAAVSGGTGGFIAWKLLCLLKKYKIGLND